MSINPDHPTAPGAAEAPEAPEATGSADPVGEPATEPTTAFERPDDPSAAPMSHDRSADEPPARQLSVSYLVTGLVFLGIAGLWLAQEVGVVQEGDLEVLGPLLLVVVGAAGLVASLAKAVRRGR